MRHGDDRSRVIAFGCKNDFEQSTWPKNEIEDQGKVKLPGPNNESTFGSVMKHSLVQGGA